LQGRAWLSSADAGPPPSSAKLGVFRWERWALSGNERAHGCPARGACAGVFFQERGGVAQQRRAGQARAVARAWRCFCTRCATCLRCARGQAAQLGFVMLACCVFVRHQATCWRVWPGLASRVARRLQVWRARPPPACPLSRSERRAQRANPATLQQGTANHL
jgi:hypothetical protein